MEDKILKNNIEMKWGQELEYQQNISFSSGK